MTEASVIIKCQLLYVVVVSCYLSCLLTIEPLSVTDIKINRGKTWNPSAFFLLLLQLQCGIHKVIFRSDFAFSRSFLRERCSGSLTGQTCSLSLVCGHRDFVGLHVGLEGSAACFTIISSQLSKHRSPTEEWVNSHIIWRWSCAGFGVRCFLYLMKIKPLVLPIYIYNI